MGTTSLALLFVAFAVAVVNASVISEDELTTLVVKIKGDDNRLFRWDATEHTVEQQKSGTCDHLPKALEIIKSSDSSNTMKRMASEYATFCVTDNPPKREELSNHDGIHQSIVDLVAAGGSASRYEDEEEEEKIDPETEAAQAAASAVSAMAAHLMYISTFANQKNQHSFFELGAVPALTSVIKGKHSSAVQIMWAAAALQNLAASYCDTDEDGRCYWDWVDEKEHVVLLDEEEGGSLISDGSKIRQAILEDKELIETLKMLACWGPVQGDVEDEEEEVVYIGENAITGKDDNNPVIIPWAAMGVLKNLALEPSAKPLIEPIMHCVCYMSGSPDWLEENKGGATLYHMRRSDPCWFVEDEDFDEEADGDFGDDEEEEIDEDEAEDETEDEEDEEDEESEDEEEYDDDDDDVDEDIDDDVDDSADSNSLFLVCVDKNFYDAEGYHCDAYADATDKECAENTDVFTGATASTACCECGGGDVQRDHYEEEEA